MSSEQCGCIGGINCIIRASGQETGVLQTGVMERYRCGIVGIDASCAVYVSWVLHRKLLVSNCIIFEREPLDLIVDGEIRTVDVYVQDIRCKYGS